MLLLTASLAVPAFAISEADVQAQVDAVGRETVTGNVLIWFLCAIGFLKAAQKIDSFMASLGVNVGHTGGSMLAEAMIAAKGVGTLAGAMGHSFGVSGGGKSGAGSNASAAAGGFFKGGLIGMARRKTAGDAVRTATSNTSAVRSDQIKSTVERASSHTAQASSHAASSQIATEAATHESHTAASQTVHATTGGATHTSQVTATATHSQHHTAPAFQGIGLGGAKFAKSLLEGGEFANSVIGTVAQGDIRSTGSITGDLAAQSLRSYMGYTALGESAKDTPVFTNVEIGGGRITGIETAPGSSEGVAFGMYHADQYAQPQGDFTKVHSADGALWYKQYAQDAVERKPYNAPDGTVAYQESIIKKLPDPPKRKDRL